MNKQQTVDYLERFVQSDYFLEFVNKAEKLFIFGEDRWWDSSFLHNNFIFFQFIVHNSDALDKLVEIANYQNISSETPFKSLFDNSKKELQKMFGGKSKEMLTILNLTYKLESYNPDFINSLRNEYPDLNEFLIDGKNMFYLLDDFLIYSVGQVFKTIEKVDNMYSYSLDEFIKSNFSLSHYLIETHLIKNVNYKYQYYQNLSSKFIFETIKDQFQNLDNDLLLYQNLYPEKKVKFNLVNWNKFRNRFLDNLKILEKGFTINDTNEQVKFYNTHSSLLDNNDYFQQHIQLFPEIKYLINNFTNYRNHKIMNEDSINKLNSKIDFQSIETKLENFYLNGVNLIESELKKCEYISKLKDEDIEWNTDMPFDYILGIGYLTETVEAYLEKSYYNFFSKS